MNAIQYLENLARNLIETPFERLFKPKFHPAKLRGKLLETMETELQYDAEGQATTPNVYRVLLNEADYTALHQRLALEEELAAIRQDMTYFALEANVSLSGPINLKIIPRPNLASGTIHIIPTQYNAAPPPNVTRMDTKQLPPTKLSDLHHE